jgi:hypothetical protein
MARHRRTDRNGLLVDIGEVDDTLLRRRLTVTHTLVEAVGEGPRLGPPKSTASERTITLPRIAVEALAHHLSSFPPVEGMIWTTERGGLLRRGSFGRIWRKAVEASVGSPCRLHDLRHGHASWLIAAGEHPKAIQARLGHGSIQVTIDRYGWLMDGLDQQTADRLDDLARSAGTAQPPRLHAPPPTQKPLPKQGFLACSPDQIRTGVTGLRGRRPRPLDDGARTARQRTVGQLGGKDSNPQ